MVRSWRSEICGTAGGSVPGVGPRDGRGPEEPPFARAVVYSVRVLENLARKEGEEWEGGFSSPI